MKKWKFTPIMNKHKIRECADFPILSKIPVGNYYKILLRVVFTLNRVVIFECSTFLVIVQPCLQDSVSKNLFKM